MILTSFFGSLYQRAYALNTANIVSALKSTGPHSRLLDGAQTRVWHQIAGANKTFGIEPVASAAKQAARLGIRTARISADRNRWPYKSDFFDCIVSNQVIEHLSHLDHFLSEASRVLKPGGILITSTNNLSSWHNIFALILGWAPFDLANSSIRILGLGNPWSIHYGKSDIRGSSWTHKCVYTSHWLRVWLDLYGLETIKIMGAGYYPLPATIGKWFPLHSAFITLISQKKQ